MNTNIDDALARLAATESPDRLDGLEDRVVAAISARPNASPVSGITCAAAGLALLLGVASNAVPPSHARRASSLSPLGAPSALAPSTLLAGSE